MEIKPFNRTYFYDKSNTIGSSIGNSNPLFEAFLVGTTAAASLGHKAQKKPHTGAIKQLLKGIQYPLNRP